MRKNEKFDSNQCTLLVSCTSYTVLSVLYIAFSLQMQKFYIYIFINFYIYPSKGACSLLASLFCSSDHIFDNNFASNRRIFLKF
jgi:hypothetical protein